MEVGSDIISITRPLIKTFILLKLDIWILIFLDHTPVKCIFLFSKTGKSIPR